MNDIRSKLKTLFIGVLILNLFNKFYCQTSELDCNFEQDICKWKEYQSIGGIKWQRAKTVNYLAPGSYPVGDHTLGKDGYYAYVGNISNANLLMRSKIISPIFTRKTSSEVCFSVWYFIYGPSLPSFSVSLMVNNTEETNARFLKTGSQGRGWNLARVNLNLEYATNYNVIIDGLPASPTGV